MIRHLPDIKAHATQAMITAGHGALSERVAADCGWLEACGYPGLKHLAEALADPPAAITLEPDALGLDLQNRSCVFIASDIEHIRAERGRIFLRNVRHGLYLLPGSVHGNYGIGCPVDPGFALGGERSKNPYVEKLEAAHKNGVEVDDAIWQSLSGRS
jgi:hypothetical protein